jgi:catechol 2,3-dioxygenase-like lactoylglutathione lyase family enzyme
MIKEASVTVIVSDMKRAIQFYVDKLGMKLIANYGDHYAQIEAPGLTVGLHPVVKDGARPGRSESMSIGFGVENLDDAVMELQGMGVGFSRRSEDGAVRLAFFADPDGNPLYLSETKERG